MADPQGRFLAGTMGTAHGTHDGLMFALSQGIADHEPVLRGITCTNGMAWTDGGKTMCVPYLFVTAAIRKSVSSLH